jgi:energy-coupling factor transport system permease protein
MNPLAKIICTFIFIIATFISYNIIFNACLLAFILLIVMMTHIPLRIYFKTLSSIKILLIFIIVINFALKVDVTITAIMMIRLITIVLYTTVLTLTTPPTEITYGLELFFAPLRIIGIPVNKMALSISLALRFIPTIIDQGNKILKSQASRGIDYYSSNIRGKFLALKAMLLPMLILSFKRADELADSMEVRLYSINKKRTNYRLNTWGFFDTYMVLIHLIVLVAIIMKEVVI